MKFFKYLAIVLALLATLVTTSVDAVTAPVATSTAIVVTPKPLTVAPVQTMSVQEKIDMYAKRYEVNAQLMRAVVKCESSFNPDAVGDNGTSFGLVQIHQPSHPTITKEQAHDPDFALNFLAKNLAAGKGKMWTCYRMITQ